METDKILYSEVCPRPLVGVYPCFTLRSIERHLDAKIIKDSGGIIKLGGILRLPDACHCHIERVIQFDCQIGHENIAIAYTFVRNTFTIPDFQSIHTLFKLYCIISCHSLHHIGVEPPVTFDEALRVLVFHLHLCVQLVHQHLPLVLITQAMYHLSHAQRFFGTVRCIRHHVEHLGHHPTAEQAAVWNRALGDDDVEKRVVVIQHDEFAAFVGCDTLTAI